MTPFPNFGPRLVDARQCPESAACRSTVLASPDLPTPPMALIPPSREPGIAAMDDLAQAEMECDFDAATRAVLRLRELGYHVTLLPVSGQGDVR